MDDIMDDTDITSDAAGINRRLLLEQLATIRSLMHEKNDEDSRDVAIQNVAKVGTGTPRNNNKEKKLAALSTDFLLTVMVDIVLLRLVNEAGRAVEFDAAATKTKKKKRAAKRKRQKQKAAAKRKKTNLFAWLGGGIISLIMIMMVAYPSATTPFVTFSLLIHPSDGSSEGKAPPASPPSITKPLRQREHQSKNGAPTSPDIISPLPVIAPPPIFVPAAVSNLRMKSDELEATCFDTPNWKDIDGYGCDDYENNGWCSSSHTYAGDMGPATDNCCVCGGGSSTLPPTNSPKPSTSPTKSATPSSSPTASSSPTITASPTQTCFDTPNWKDIAGDGCDVYDQSAERDDDYTNDYIDDYYDEEDGWCSMADDYAGDMGPATDNCCICRGGSNTLPPTNSPKPSISPTKSTTPTQACFDTPNWRDTWGSGCDYYAAERDDDYIDIDEFYIDDFDYEDEEGDACSMADDWAGDMGPATDNCCACGGGSSTLPPTNSPKPSTSPTKSATPSSSPSISPSNPPSISANPTQFPSISSSPTISANPTQTCIDTPNWEDMLGHGCDWYKGDDDDYYLYSDYYSRCYFASSYAGDMGPASQNCCVCGKEPCVDTPNWNDGVHGCAWYEENDSHGCPKYGELFGEKVMGLAKHNCCYCMRKVVPLVTPSAPPSISTSPTISLSPSLSPTSTPTSSSCADTEGWYNSLGYDCSWYEAMDLPGCPKYGDLYKVDEDDAYYYWYDDDEDDAYYYWYDDDDDSTIHGAANDHCCHCKNAAVSTPSPTKTPSSSTSTTCIDTPGWVDIDGNGCDYYKEFENPGCPNTDNRAGIMGPATEHCCYCKNPSCVDFRSKCQEEIVGISSGSGIGEKAPFCEEAESFCCEGADHDIKIVTDVRDGDKSEGTVGLYNGCKCNFWLRLCEDTTVGEACDYAAEYCCGDYGYNYKWGFSYLNSPICYCDFFNYAQNEFGHTLKSKALNISEEFDNPCGQYEDLWFSISILDKTSLEAIYNGTNVARNHLRWRRVCVTGIDLRDNNLSGQFPVYTRNEIDRGYGSLHYLDSHWRYTKYGLANLRKLKTLDLADNKLTGAIEYAPLYNLPSLTHFDVSGNQLSGVVNALVAPSLTHADFSNNLFTSMRRFQNYKVSPLQTLSFCDVSNNNIEIDAADVLKNMPSNIEQFISSNNSISGNLPASLNNLPQLRQFDMSFNSLSGNLPGFTESFTTLQELDLSKQMNGFNFTGSIPENMWRCLSLQKLILADNRLTGSIPSLVGNLAVLEVFDLSGNILRGSIPSEFGMLEGSLKHLRLSNNMFTGIIPAEIGQLQGASVLLQGNKFYNSSTTAPLSLCMLRSGVKEFDLVNDTVLCPVERNTLSDFYDLAKGAEWTNDTNWLDEYESYCNWHGVTCDSITNRITRLELANNGLSGRLSDGIANLTSTEKLDLSDNDIKGSIPSEIGLLSNLTYLRLSYNAFTGTAPESLGDLTKLRLLQLQSNRIIEMPEISRLDETEYENSTFVTDCGVPSAFDEALKCVNCTMCCNANDDCYPQQKTRVAKMGLNYVTFAVVLFCIFIVLCCVVSLCLYRFGTSKTSRNRRPEEDETYALKNIGRDSVYSYIVTEKRLGWLAAFITLGIQFGILVLFVLVSEANLQDDNIEIQFTWKCPRDSDVCDDKADLSRAGWFIFSLLMIAFLAKDMINGSKLIYHSSKVRHTLGSRIRYFVGGTSLCSITLFALYVSTVYNSAIATSNTEIIVNSVVVLFVMEIDEYIFAAFHAINDKLTEHAAESEEISEMKEELIRQRVQIASQQEEIDNQSKDLRMLRETVEKIQEAQASAATNTPQSESTECEVCVDPEQFGQAHQITLPCLAEEEEEDAKEKQEAQAAAGIASSDIESIGSEVDVDAQQMGQAHQITLPYLAEDEEDVKECTATARIASSSNTSE